MESTDEGFGLGRQLWESKDEGFGLGRQLWGGKLGGANSELLRRFGELLRRFGELLRRFGEALTELRVGRRGVAPVEKLPGAMLGALPLALPLL